MVWCGKLLVFLAGLTILIDLVEPDRLRARGVRLYRRCIAVVRQRRELMEASRMVQLRRDIMHSFVRYSSVDDSAGSSVVLCGLVHSPPSAAPAPELDEGRFIAFWHAVMDDVGERFGLREKETSRRVEAAVPYIQRRVDEFLRDATATATATDGSRLVERAAAIEQRSTGFSAFFVAAACVAAMGVAYLLQDWNGPAAGGIGLVLLTVLVTLAIMPSMAPGVIGARMQRRAALSLLCVSRLLNRSRPLHPFRWAAAGCFVVGSLIDLVTSWGNPA